MALYRHRSGFTEHYLQLMVSLPVNRFLLIKDPVKERWELTLNAWLPNAHTDPQLTARQQIAHVFKMSPLDKSYSLTKICTVIADIQKLHVHVYSVKPLKLFKFTSVASKEFKIRSLSDIVNDLLNEGAEPGMSNIYTTATVAVLRNIGDTELLWDRRLENSWKKKSTLLV